MQNSFLEGTVNRGGCTLPMSNEDWQFENPRVQVAADGTILRSELVPEQVQAPIPKPKPIAEFFKEADNVRFIGLPIDKQIKLVAEEYNKGSRPIDIQRKLGIKGAGTYYDRLEKAKAMGLVAEMRGQVFPKKEVKPVVVAEPDPEAKPIVVVDDFARIAAEKIKMAEELTKEADLLQQAGTIAQALTELLGDQAGDLVAGLYSKVSVGLKVA